jgi:hypothetical protein
MEQWTTATNFYFHFNILSPSVSNDFTEYLLSVDNEFSGREFKQKIHFTSLSYSRDFDRLKSWRGGKSFWNAAQIKTGQ